MFVRALAYMLSHGADGLRQASEDAVLNANYIRVGLRDLMGEPFGDRPCMHEVLFDDSFLDGTGVTTLDFAKAMIDEGFHPMTMYFPLVVHGAMLIEPTESESKASLDPVHRDAARPGDAGEARRGRTLPPGATAGAAPPPRRDQGGALAEAEVGEAGALQRGRGVGGFVCLQRSLIFSARTALSTVIFGKWRGGFGAARQTLRPLFSPRERPCGRCWRHRGWSYVRPSRSRWSAARGVRASFAVAGSVIVPRQVRSPSIAGWRRMACRCP
jgi:hypothetical protein